MDLVLDRTRQLKGHVVGPAGLLINHVILDGKGAETHAEHADDAVDRLRDDEKPLERV